MDCTFASDNTSGVHPKVMEALNKANVGAAEPYGDDPWTAEAEGCFKALFGDDVDVFLVPLGTGANVLGFNRMIRSWHSILCSDMAHTHTSESGAVEAVVGCKMTPIPSVHGKISAGALSAYLTDMGSPHHSQPGLVALTQSTEVATVYTPEEIRAIVDVAHANGLYVHMDGARIANATVALGCDVRSFTKDLGVDMMSFGGTKNGMMMAESVVVFNKDFVRDFVTLRKQNLQLASKMRFLAAQYIAYFKDGLWLENARHANNMARLLADLISGMPHVELAHPVESNGVFVNMKPEHIAALQRQYMFHEVEPSAHTVRWMLSFNTSEEQVRAFPRRSAHWHRIRLPVPYGSLSEYLRKAFRFAEERKKSRRASQYGFGGQPCAASEEEKLARDQGNLFLKGMEALGENFWGEELPFRKPVGVELPLYF